jgi:hypothetical protein
MKKTHVLLCLAVMFIASSCGSGKTAAKADPFVGEWNLMVSDTPQGDMPITMMIGKDENGAYTGSFSSDAGNNTLNNLKIENNEMSATFVYGDMDFDVTGTFAENLFKGYTSGMGADFKTEGKKVEQQQ